MAKKPEATEPAGTQLSSVATKLSDYKSLVGKVVSANNAMDEGRQRKSELIADAVEGKKLHKAAFAWVMKLRKMDPVKRNELLFHFEVYCGYEEFAREDLLPDRSEDTEDLRPRHLRQPGASAATAVQDLAEGSGAKLPPKDDPIDQVGRGKPLN